MKRSAFILSTVFALVALPLAIAGNAQQAAPKPRPEEPKAAPSPAPAQASPQKNPGAAAGKPTEAAKLKPTMRIFQGEFRAVDLEKKTLTFQTDDGKSYTVEAQVPGLPEAVERAAQLAQILKPGDRIRMLCRVNEKLEPTLILTLHMIGNTAPIQYR